MDTEIREVIIPSRAEHCGIPIYLMAVKLYWVCPECGEKRGEIYHNAFSYDGSRRLVCDGWKNPCGHIDRYSDVRKEAVGNGLNVREAKREVCA